MIHTWFFASAYKESASQGIAALGDAYRRGRCILQLIAVTLKDATESVSLPGLPAQIRMHLKEIQRKVFVGD